MEVTIDTFACKGYANCIIEAPDVFDVDEATGKAVVLSPSPGEELRPEVGAAVRMCPANAITVEG